MENAGPRTDVDDILASLFDGLKRAEETMSSIIESIASDNAHALSELEAALTDIEAALAND